METNSELKFGTDRVERCLQQLIDGCGLSALSKAAASYAIFPGGKRVRARLIIALASDLQSEITEFAIQAAAGVELLHCASLVHDDLPALDNDVLRRGRPTLHVKFGAGTATLVGDILATLPFSLPHFPAALGAHAFATLCDGQVLDLERAKSGAELLEIHCKKTGALFGLCFALGCGQGRSSEVMTCAQRCGELIGIEFQLRNDLADAHDARGASDSRNERLSDSVQREIPALLATAHTERTNTLQALTKLSGSELRSIQKILTEIFGE